MRKDHQYKKPGAEARERAHQFGQPDGNKPGNPSTAANQREFYRWAETRATEKELQEYRANTANPYARRKFVELLLTKCDALQDVFDLTNQTHGQPKQVIEQTNLPAIEIVLE